MTTLEELLRQGKSFAQGASNGVASTLTGPVDTLAWLLRKGGLPVGDAPIGGEQWMRNQGLMATPENKLAGLLGEGAGLAAPIVAAAKAPEIAGGLLQMGRNLATPQTLNKQAGAIVYHGSPHKFDKFDSSKIGTGEGAQAYGHGLYLAESPAVAGQYADTLGVVGAVDNGGNQIGKTGVVSLFSKALKEKGLSDAAALSQATQWADNFIAGKPVTHSIASGVVQKNGLKAAKDGSLYKVDLPDEHIAKMLDWDKPLSQQPQAIQDAVKPLLTDAFDVRGYKGGWGSLEPDADAVRDVFTKTGHSLGTFSAQDAAALNFPGSAIVKALGNMDTESAATAQLLRKQGLTGIRYLDGGSRSAGAGSSNFVVFPGNEGLLKILERNGGKP